MVVLRLPMLRVMRPAGLRRRVGRRHGTVELASWGYRRCALGARVVALRLEVGRQGRSGRGGVRGKRGVGRPSLMTRVCRRGNVVAGWSRQRLGMMRRWWWMLLVQLLLLLLLLMMRMMLRRRLLLLLWREGRSRSGTGVWRS